MDALTIVQAAQLAVFVGLALLAIVHWRRQGGAAIWLATSFGLLVVVLGAARLDLAGDAGFGLAVHKAQVAALVLFPYFLYRFMRGYAAGSRTADHLALALTAVLIVWLALLPEQASTDPGTPLVARALVYALLLQWVLLAGTAGARLWRAGADQSPVARARMRMLSAGVFALVVTLLLAGFGPEGSEFAFVIAFLSIAAGLAFYLAFVPPRFVRAAWRRPADAALWEIEHELATATTAREVGELILPRIARFMGADRAALVDRHGTVIASEGVEGEEAIALTQSSTADVSRVPLRNGGLIVGLSRLAPYRGRDEDDLLRAFGYLTDLALERASLFAAEREARALAESAQEEIAALVYGLSHDLQTPIASVAGYVDLLRSDHAEVLSSEGRDFLDRIEANAAYMRDLLTDLLQLSRVGTVETDPEAVDIAALALEVAEEVGRRHPDRRIVVEAVRPAWMNPVRARQLLTNLVENAAVHGGRDDLTVRVLARESPLHQTAFAVADDGQGIPAEDEERIFGIFERGPSPRSESEGGSGIGLAICRKIVEAAGGTIRLGEAAVGTTIEVTLPAPPGPTSERARTAPDAANGADR